MTLSPRSETIAYRTWCAARENGWNFSLMEAAQLLDVNPSTLKMIAQQKGWLHRFRAPNPEGRPVVTTMKDVTYEL